MCINYLIQFETAVIIIFGYVVIFTVNTMQFYFEKGLYSIVSMEDYDDNMSSVINQAMIDYIRLTKL